MARLIDLSVKAGMKDARTPRSLDQERLPSTKGRVRALSAVGTRLGAAKGSTDRP